MDSRKNLTWKWILIASVLLICGISMYPPKERLNLGLDLRGGVSLLYEVNTDNAPNAEEVIKQTIQVLQQRVDPTGVRNLNWRVEAGSRIEIQMPQPSPEVGERRQRYEEALAKFDATGISRADVMAVIQSPNRAEAIRNKAAGVTGRQELLEKAAASYDVAQQARAEMARHPAGSPEFIAGAEKTATAERAFEDVMKAVLATNLDRSRLGPVLEMSTLKPRKEGKELPSPREVAIERLVQDFPARAEQIRQAVKLHDDYQQVKGPLDDANDLIRLLRGAGVLEFRIGVSRDEVANPQQVLQQLAERGPRFSADPNQRWFVLDDPTTWADTARDLVSMRENPTEYFAARGLIGGEYGGKYYVLLWDSMDKSLTQKQKDWQLTNAYGTPDQRGFPAVSFQMNTLGGAYMAALTGANKGRQMAIVLDGRVYSAPTINDQIHDSGIITGGRGGFTQTQMDYLIRTLGAGSLKARLSEEPISVRTVGPSLGADNLHRGLEAVVLSLIAVGLFMTVYYFFGGLVATIAVLANVIITLGVMAGLHASFTLPGIAGIVLTIGMCVDANVLIFERMREELKRGADMVTAVRLGYQKAFSAIIDGNLTTLIVCFVLVYSTTADIAGFGTTLGIGIAATLLASLFMTQVFFQTVYGPMHVRKKMNMLPLAVPAVERALQTNINWMSKKSLFLGVAVGSALVGVILCFTLGSNLLDVEFRGGTEVTFDLKGDHHLKLGEARERVDKAGLRDATVIAVGDLDKEFRAEAFSVVTSETDPQKVGSAVRTAFADVLAIEPRIQFTGGNVEATRSAPVFPITRSDIGSVINRPAAAIESTDEVGGVAIVLDNMNPPASAKAIGQRIKSMRLQPDFESVQFRSVRVLPLQPGAGEDTPVTSAVVLVKPDQGVSYFDDPANWEANLAGVEWNVVRTAMSREASLNKVSNFTPTVAHTLTQQAIVAIIISSLAIIAYVWLRFGSLRWGVAAIFALVLDVALTFGLIAICHYFYMAAPGVANGLLVEPFKINMTLVAAILTIVGYSINDKIVIFDRIRENRGRLNYVTPELVNVSINQTLGRTFLTGGGVLMAVLILYIVGGEAIRGFAFAMFVGVSIGTLTSICVAAPLIADRKDGASPTLPVVQGEPAKV